MVELREDENGYRRETERETHTYTHTFGREDAETARSRKY